MKKILFLLLATTALFSCGRFGNRETDGKKDQRIVCLSKHLTEMVFALGKGHNIVAVDLSSTFPDSAKLLKTVGYHRALSPESIIAMNPDLVIHSNDIGPENVLPQITPLPERRDIPFADPGALVVTKLNVFRYISNEREPRRTPLESRPWFAHDILFKVL